MRTNHCGCYLALAAAALAFAIVFVAPIHADDKSIAPPSSAELAAISDRGRALTEYDQAAWHATDAVQMANPKTTEGQHCLAKKENGKWTVVFGALSADNSKFLIAFEARPSAKPQEFSIVKNEPALADVGFYLFAARALELAIQDFGKTSRPYNTAALPARENQLYVYLYPAPTKPGVYPLGADVRYLVSSDGQKIIEKRQLHKTTIESQKNSPKGSKVVASFHTHVLSDLPEDTDVLNVLQQDPPVPAMIGTINFQYEIRADGSIAIKKAKK